MQIPTVNPQQAGQVATHGDMNNYSAAASFLLNPPMAHAFALSGGQSGVVAGAANTMQWNRPDHDNDGTFNVAFPDRFFIQTQGFYEVQARVLLSPAATEAQCYLRVTTGTANPGGSGNQFTSWYSTTGFTAGEVLGVSTAGILPQLMYPGDFVQFIVNPLFTCATGTIFGYYGDWSHRLVSL